MTEPTISGYRIDGEIGSGGQAVVYRATQATLGRPTALKLLTGAPASDRIARARFEREAESIAALEHPHILPVYDAGERDGHRFIAMKYVSGGSLSERLRAHGALAVPIALRLLGQLAAALDHAHANGVAHRDIKPANVLLASDEHAYLADFGLSRHEAAPTLTPLGAWLGTPEYTAPEVLRGELGGPEADRYAFALLAFEVLTGRSAFTRVTPAAVVYAHLNDPPPKAHEIRPGLGREASDVLSAGMAKRPERRHESAVALVDELTEVIAATPGALDVEAPPVDPPVPERDRSTVLGPVLAGPRRRASSVRRRRRFLPRGRTAVSAFAAAASLALAVGVGGLSGLGSAGEQPPAAVAGVAAPQADGDRAEPPPGAPPPPARGQGPPPPPAGR